MILYLRPLRFLDKVRRMAIPNYEKIMMPRLKIAADEKDLTLDGVSDT
jgi:hypothetical protein